MVKPIILITGAGGNLGRSIAGALADAYTIVGLDREPDGDLDFAMVAADFTSKESLDAALATIRAEHGASIASVIHLAAFFDFTGEDHPLYRELNVEGTRHLLRGLQAFDVEQFVYASTMLVHAPGEPGGSIDEHQPIDPQWAYPKSKAEAEQAVREEHGQIPYVLLRLAGVYDEETMVPTLAQQIGRIYGRDLQSHFYSGSTDVGQAMLHREDMVEAIRRTVDRRADLPPDAEILIGEEDAPGYDQIQDAVGQLIHGEEDWATLRIPKPIAAAGAWVQGKLEPVIPDAIDQGEEPFIKPFMVRMADDHYALDISRARDLLGWEPRHRLMETLPAMIAGLKRDPAGWHEKNQVTLPDWAEDAEDAGHHPELLRKHYEAKVKAEHGRFRWAHFANIALGTWIATQPLLIAVEEPLLAWSELVLGLLLILFASVALSWRGQWARWVCAAIGMGVMAAPFIFWTTNAAAYLSDTLVGMLVIMFALAPRPDLGVSPVAAMEGPDVPPGWDYNPSTWSQRIPIIALALIGLYVSRYLAAYQLEHIPGVWDPFFAGSLEDPRNGTEEIVTSWVAEAWPVSDAAVAGMVYAMEIITGAVGSRQRWRTMPWLVILFGILIAPLGIVSIFFIVIQPIWLGTWSIIALIGAAAMLVQIPYSLDELLASIQFIRRRAKAGQNWLRVMFVGDTDEGEGRRSAASEFDAPAGAVLREMIGGGVNLPWSLAFAAAIGLSLLFTRVTLGTEGAMANADHLIGALILTVVSLAAAEVARALRYLLIPLGVAMLVTPFAFGASGAATMVSVALGIAVIALAFPRGAIRNRYGTFDPLVR